MADSPEEVHSSSPLEVPDPPALRQPAQGSQPRLDASLKRAWVAYNQAWSRRREPGADADLAAARLDVLLALAQDGDAKLEPALMAQLTDDAAHVLDLVDDVYPDVSDGPAGRMAPDAAERS